MFDFYDGVEGETYIFDRYAYLGVKPDASHEEIISSIKRLRTENHPDRLAKSGEKVKATAELEWNNIGRCESILLDEDKRKHFDERLAWFKENASHLVSTNGMEKIDPTFLHVDLGFLARQQSLPLEDMKESMRAAAGVDEKTLRVIRKAFQADPTDVETKEAYGEALSKYLQFLTAQEGLAWMNAGVYGYTENQSPVGKQDAQFYTEAIAEDIQEFARRVIPSKVEARALEEKAGLAQAIALLPDPEHPDIPVAPLALITQEARAKMTEVVQETFLSRTHSIKEIASRKQETLQEILALSETYEINPGGKNPPKAEIYLVTKMPKGEPEVLLSVMIENGKAGVLNSSKGKRLDELREHPPQHAAYAVEFNPALEPIMQVVHCHKKNCVGEQAQQLSGTNP